MGESDRSTKLANFGYEAQQKFDFYAVALAFTVLGLAVQTAGFGTSPVSDLFELLAWVALLVSGTAGLHCLEWQPQVFQLRGLEASQQSRLTGLREARVQGADTVHALDSGSDLNVDQMIASDENGLDLIRERIKTVSDRATRGYRVRSIGLLLGLVSLVISRGLDPLLALLRLLGGE